MVILMTNPFDENEWYPDDPREMYSFLLAEAGRNYTLESHCLNHWLSVNRCYRAVDWPTGWFVDNEESGITQMESNGVVIHADMRWDR